jgi:predicted Zn-dependent peptidase
MIQTHILPNGLVIMMERLPYLRSVAIGLFVKAGSIMEEADQNGLSHFIEHMAFKGTSQKNARQIAMEIDLIGGNVNASTSKTATVYYAHTTDKDLKKALDLLSDMLVNPQATEEDFERERQVILEEIDMETDSPEDLVFNLLHEKLYPGQTLSRTILGSKEAVSSYTLANLKTFRQAYYIPGNTVLSVAGHFKPEQLIAWAEEAFLGWLGEGRKLAPAQIMLTGPAVFTKDKDIEQAHLCINYPGFHGLHEDRHALAAFSAAFGGGVSSRLFQKVREEHGLVYNIYSGPSFYPDNGEFTIYAACSPGKANRVLDLIQQEVAAVVRDGISRQEFEKTMAQIKTGFVLGMESAYQRMASMGINQLLHERIIAPRELLAMLRKIKRSDINRVARQVLSSEPVLAAVGKKIGQYLNKGGGGDGQA